MWSSKQLKQLTLDKNYLYNARQTFFFHITDILVSLFFPEAATGYWFGKESEVQTALIVEMIYWETLMAHH